MDPRGTPTDSPTPITIDHLDGTHMGIGVVLLRATLDEDFKTRRVVSETVSAVDSLRSTLELLLVLARNAAEANGEHDGGARFMAAVAGSTSSPAKANFCRQVACALTTNPSLDHLGFTPLPVFAVVDICVLLTRLIAHRTGIDPRQQVEKWTEHVRQQALATA